MKNGFSTEKPGLGARANGRMRLGLSLALAGTLVLLSQTGSAIAQQLAVEYSGAYPIQAPINPMQTGPVLSGSVRQSVQRAPQSAVRDADSGEGLIGVMISYPATGQRLQSDKNGVFRLPAVSGKPAIVSFNKPGYVPTSMTLQPGLQGPFQVTLHRLQANAQLVLDDQLRHLGDNSYAPNSAGAAKFRRGAEGTALVREFRLLSPPPKDSVTLLIGSILGLDTQAAHATGQSGFHHASTPMRVLLNGAPVTQIALNGDGQRLQLPSSLMRENNTLVIETGYNVPDGTYVDYDDMELMNLVLEF